jgi:hypothetical protein
MVKKALITVLAAISFALIATFALPGQALASDSEPGKPDDVVCLAIDHCPELPPPDRCDPAGNCEVSPEPDCYEAPNGECVPPWCNPSRPISDCPVEPPYPPFCEDGADFCIPPMPPWCDEAGNCEEPPGPPFCGKADDPSEPCIEWPPLPPVDCDPAGNCEWPGPDDPIVCVMGWPSDEPMPDCPGIYPPPFCGDEGGEVRPLPAPQARIKFPGREELCWPPPPFCESDPTEPGTKEPGEVEEGSGSEPGFEGENIWKYRSDEIPPDEGDETVEDPLPCIYPPDYGCFEDETGQILCVDPPVSDCWEVKGKPGLVACPIAEGRPLQKGGKSKAAKAKARAKARAAKARAKAKAKKVKAAKAKAKAKARR